MIRDMIREWCRNRIGNNISVFVCECGWLYVMTKRMVVVGPFIPDCGKHWLYQCMTREQWQDEYADCARNI